MPRGNLVQTKLELSGHLATVSNNYVCKVYKTIYTHMDNPLLLFPHQLRAQLIDTVKERNHETR